MELRNKGAWSGDRYRVIVSTDIGGSDPERLSEKTVILTK